jgi:hypothetical protein
MHELSVKSVGVIRVNALSIVEVGFVSCWLGERKITELSTSLLLVEWWTIYTV